MKIQGKANDFYFPELFSMWKRYSDYEIVEVVNPFSIEIRNIYKASVPQVEKLKVIKPVTGATVEEFNPLEGDTSNRLLTELARLGNYNSDRDILRFVNGYGLFGMAEYLRGETHWPAYEEAMNFEDGTRGELLWHIEDQIRVFKALLKIYEALKDSNFRALSQLISPAYLPSPENGDNILFNFEVLGTPDFVFSVPRNFVYITDGILEETYFFAGYRYIQGKINKYLSNNVTVGVSLGKIDNGYAFVPGFGVNSLITCAYWQLRDLVTNMKDLRRCVYCGERFIPKTDRQIACPPIYGEKKSACANRAAVAKHAEEKKKAKNGDLG